MSSRFLLYNGPGVTTGSFTPVATGTSLKTLLQVKPALPCRIVEWGISFDGFTAAAPGKVELIEVNAAATVTAHTDADVAKLPGVQDYLNASNFLTFSTTATGYTSSGEGSITLGRYLDAPQLIAPTTQFVKQIPLGERPFIQVGSYARIRVLFGTTVNATCYMILEV